MAAHSRPEVHAILETLSVVDMAEEILRLRQVVRDLLPLAQRATHRGPLELSDGARGLAAETCQRATDLLALADEERTQS